MGVILNRLGQLTTLPILLLQEPPVHRGKVSKVPNYTIIAAENPRACIWLPNDVIFWHVPISHPDCAVVAIEDSLTKKVVLVSSVYCDITAHPEIILRHVKSILDYAEKGQFHIILGMDTNAWSGLWGMDNNNARGDYFEQFVLSNQLEIANTGSTHTFVGAIGQTIIDVTMHDPELHILEWMVSTEDVLSDHRSIRFKIELDPRVQIKTRKLKQADWQGFRQALGERTAEISTVDTWNYLTLNEGVTRVYDKIIGSLDVIAPIKDTTIRRKVKKWPEELKAAHKRLKKARWLKKHHPDDPIHAQNVRERRQELSKIRKKHGQKTWLNFTSTINDASSISKLSKAINCQKKPNVGMMSNGEITTSGEEVLNILYDAHFPDSSIHPVATEIGRAHV